MIRFPEPPSANRYWRSYRGRVVVSPEAKAYKEAVWVVAKRAKLQPLTGDVALTLVWHRGRRSGDLSNRIKVLEDALRGLWYADDKQVASIHATRQESPGDGFVLVDVTPLDTATRVV